VVGGRSVALTPTDNRVIRTRTINVREHGVSETSSTLVSRGGVVFRGAKKRVNFFPFFSFFSVHLRHFGLELFAR